MTITRWKCTVEYDGTPYSGWQKQENASSVQQVVEEAIQAFCGQDIRIQGAGRTDAGVHAKGQVFHFDLDYGERTISGFALSKAINAHMLDHPVSVVKAEEVDDEFHARFSATNKLYTYRILNRRTPPALDVKRVWHVKVPCDADLMAEGAKYLLGKHDFTTFRASVCQAKNPIRTLDRIEVEALPYDEYGGQEIRIHAEARAFLHHQIRNFAGTLVYVGIGKWKPIDVKTALEAKNREAGGPTAPSYGLSLMHIDYP